MIDTITRFVQALPDMPGKMHLITLFKALGDRLSSQPLATAGLVIKAGGGVLTKIGATPTMASPMGSWSPSPPRRICRP